MAYRTQRRLRQILLMSVEVDEVVHETMETADLADIEVVRLRTEHLQHQYGHARRI